MNKKHSFLRWLLVVTFCCLPFFAQATAPMSEEQYKQALQRILQHEQRLTKELQQLQADVRRLKQARYAQVAKPTAAPRRKVHRRRARRQHRYIKRHTKPKHNVFEQHAVSFLGGIPVLTSPYFGIRAGYDASRLIVNISSNNEDLRLLKQRQQINANFRKKGQAPFSDPVVDISGKFEGIVSWNEPYVGATRGDVDISSAKVDVAVMVNPWALLFMEFNFDNSPPGIGLQRYANSRFFMNKGFATIGNLDESPVYFTIGQVFVPFGRFSTGLLSATLPEVMAETKARAVVLGYQTSGNKGFFGSIFAFRGDANPHGRENGGINLAYGFDNGTVSGEFGVSGIANVADAQGMQATGGAGFGGFSGTLASQNLTRRIPGIDGHWTLQYGKHRFLVEYFTALRRFSMADLTFNGRGAKPRALHVETSYGFNTKKPSGIVIAYAHTGEAFALNLPRDRFLLGYNISLWRDTIQSIEFRHDKNYAMGTMASGRGPMGALVPMSTSGLGKESNQIVAQMGFYF